MKSSPRWLYWLPAIVWMVVIFTFSSHPVIQTSSIDWQDFFVKKTAHFIEYSILTGLYIFALGLTTNWSWKKIVLLSCLFSIVYAISDEFHQSFVPGREPKIRDVFIDGLGTLSVGLLSFKKKWLDIVHYRV